MENIKMKKEIKVILVITALLCSSFIFVSHQADAITWVEGHISVDTTWTVADSPFIVTNDVFVDENVTLIIEPGVEIRFGGYFSIIVNGSLSAVGTQSDKIVFTSNKVNPAEGDWNTIKSNCMENGTFEMSYCEVKYGTNGVTANTMEQTIVENSCMHNNSNAGIYITGKNDCLLKKNTIKWNKYGINSNGYESSGISIIDNSITNNSDHGIYLETHYDIYNVNISGNNINANSNGIYLYAHAHGYYPSSYICNVNISGNNINANSNGIYLYADANDYTYIYNVSISGNTINANNDGIYIYADADDYTYIYNVNISGNTINASSHGIYIYAYIDSRYGDDYAYVYNVYISGNTINANSNGIYLYAYVDGYHYYSYAYIYNVSISGNTINANNDGIYIYADADDYTYIYNVNISGNTINASSHGIYIYAYVYHYYAYVYNVYISGNTINASSHGIYIYAYGYHYYAYVVYNVSISGNTINANSNGIYLDAYADIYNVNISGNPINANSNGIYLDAYDDIYNVNISKNIVILCDEVGIKIKGRKYGNFINKVFGNIVSSCGKGVVISGGNVANVSNNSISYNKGHGVIFEDSTGNVAHCNNIYNNMYGMNVSDGATVDAEYNYWGDETGPYHESMNPWGKGNPVNGDGTDLDFIPFTTSPYGEINERPVADIQANRTYVQVGQKVRFDASNSTDDGEIMGYYFDYGDNTTTGWVSTTVVIHEYDSPSSYNVTLKVRDDYGVESNNTAYVIISVSEEENLPPEITNVQDFPDPQEIGGWVNITCNVIDNVGVDTVKVNITYPASGINATMINIPGTDNYYYNSTYTVLGTYYYFIWANDTSDNKNISGIYQFMIEDTSPPEISNVTDYPDPQIPEGWVNITCDVTDNVAVNEVWVNITYPSSGVNATMTNIPGTDTYYYNSTYNDTGTYNYFIWANDTSNNENVSGIYSFTIIPTYGSISGIIIYSCNGTVIRNATINLLQNGSLINSTTTDSNGSYTFNDLGPGEYNVTAWKPYFWKNSTSVIVNLGEENIVNLTLLLIGDLDNNGNVADAVDVTMMIHASVGDIPPIPPSVPIEYYDLDGNGQPADAVDVTMMIQASVGDIPESWGTDP